MALILDTGPLYASLDRTDHDYAACRDLIESSDEKLVVPSPVLVEVDQLIGSRLHPGIRSALLEDVEKRAYLIEDVLPEDYARVKELCDRYADVGFVDAAVLAVVERLNEPKLATLDSRHFHMMRPRHVSALRLLPD